MEDFGKRKEVVVMGMRFHKSFKVAPGVKINLNKSSASVSFGGKHARTTVNTKGQKTTSVGTPIKGVSYRSTTSGNKENGSVQTVPSGIGKWIFKSDDPEAAKRDNIMYRIAMYLSFIACIPILFIGLVCITAPGLGIPFFIIGAILLCMGIFSRKRYKRGVAVLKNSDIEIAGK